MCKDCQKASCCQKADASTAKEKRLAGRFKNRRRMAWVSFSMVILFGVVVMGVGLWSDAGAARVAGLVPALSVFTGLWVAVVLAYFGSSTIEHNKAAP